MVEEAGIPTMILSMMPAWQPIVGAPRVAAIAHPFGRPFGDAGDAATQRGDTAGQIAAGDAVRDCHNQCAEGRTCQYDY